jgi:hypothetical protein
MKVVGTLLHLVNLTRPDLAHAVRLLCRFNHAPGPTHVAAAKGVLRYLHSTKHKGVSYTTTSTPVQGFCDSDYAGDVDGRKSTTGCIWTKNGGPISWQSKLQSVVAQSTCEAEYYGAGSATKEALWLKKSLSDFGLPVITLPIFTYNQASLSLLKHGAVSPATKHISVIYHVVRDSVLRGMSFFPTSPLTTWWLIFSLRLFLSQHSGTVLGKLECTLNLSCPCGVQLPLWPTRHLVQFFCGNACYGHCSFPLLVSMQLHNTCWTKLTFYNQSVYSTPKMGGS